MEIVIGFFIGAVTTFGFLAWWLTGQDRHTDFNGYEQSKQTSWDTQTK